ncbi:MAG: hypothetical protein QXZ12_08730 [Thermoplasmata archaeon]
MNQRYEIKRDWLSDMNLVTVCAEVICSNLIKGINGNIIMIDNLSSSTIALIKDIISEKK